jgi:hypothetical protein
LFIFIVKSSSTKYIFVANSFLKHFWSH